MTTITTLEALKQIRALTNGAERELGDELTDRQVITEDLIENVRRVLAQAGVPNG